MLGHQDDIPCSCRLDGSHPLIRIELRGIENLWTGRSVSPFPVHESIGAKVDDHAELEVLPLYLLRGGLDLSKVLSKSNGNEDQQPQGHHCKHPTGTLCAHEYPVSRLTLARSIARQIPFHLSDYPRPSVPRLRPPLTITLDFLPWFKILTSAVAGHKFPPRFGEYNLFFVSPVSVKIQWLVLVCVWLEFLVGCGGSLQLSIHPSVRCDPYAAPEVLSLTIQNTGPETLQNYPVAISLDESVFDFTVPKDGSDVAVWDAASRKPMSTWLESYDATAGKALLWVKVPGLGRRASQRLLLTAGNATNCATSLFDGHSVFPFFSDVHDVSAWHATNRLRVTDTITEGPLSIGGRSLIESDGMYNGFPGVAQAANGDFVLAYKKGVSHVNSPFVVLRRSTDAGTTWSPEVVYFDSSQPDPALIRTPLGAMLMALGKADQNGDAAGAYSRSADNGLTWSPFAFFADPPRDVVGVAPSLNVGQMMYGTGYGAAASGIGFTPSLWLSADDGFTWTKLSELREPGDPGLNETAIAQTAPYTLFAMMRADDSLKTYGRYSSDMGANWGPLISYTSQVGVLQAPMMVQAGSGLILMGRREHRDSRGATGRYDGISPAAGCFRFLRWRADIWLRHRARHLYRAADRWRLLLADATAGRASVRSLLRGLPRPPEAGYQVPYLVR